MQQQNIQAQADANAQAQQVAAQAEIQKNQVITSQKAQLMEMENQFALQKMQAEVEAKKALMAQEFQYNMQLKGIEVQGKKSQESEKEDRKDDRTKLQATQQSELIEQRKNNTPPKNFESSGNDILGGGFDLGSFEPR